MHYHSRKARLAFHHSQITQNQAGSTPCSRNLAGHQDYTEPELESSILTPSACNTMHQSRIAVLIDGDNAYLGYLERVMAEAGQHGVVVSRRIYGGSVVLDSLAGMHQAPRVRTHIRRGPRCRRQRLGKRCHGDAQFWESQPLLHSRKRQRICQTGQADS